MSRYKNRIQKELQTLENKYGDDFAIDEKSTTIDIYIIENIDEKDIGIILSIYKEDFPFENLKIKCIEYGINYKIPIYTKRIIDIVADLVSKIKQINNNNIIEYDDNDWNIHKKFDLLVICATEDTKNSEKWKNFINSKYIANVSFSGTGLKKPISNNNIAGKYDIIFAEFCFVHYFEYLVKNYSKDLWGSFNSDIDLVVKNNLKYGGFLVIPNEHYERLRKTEISHIKILKLDIKFWEQIRPKYLSYDKKFGAYQKQKQCLVCGKKANFKEENGSNIFCSKECQIKYYNE